MSKTIQDGGERSSKGKSFFNVETLLIIAIALCMIFLNSFTVKKLNELERAGRSSIFIKDDLDFEATEELAEYVKDYLPDAYKMIELYDENLDLMFQVQFNDDTDGYLGNGDIKTRPELVELLKENEEGQTSLIINDKEEALYFRWVVNTRGDTRLLMVYNSIEKVSGIWLFSFICYLVIILVFILLIRLHTKAYKDKVEQYRKNTRLIVDRLRV